MNEFIKAIESNTAYEFICENGWSMSKQELTDIVKELLYGIEKCENGQIDGYEILDEVASELESLYEE